jgi:hypothetical protein
MIHKSTSYGDFGAFDGLYGEKVFSMHRKWGSFGAGD